MTRPTAHRHRPVAALLLAGLLWGTSDVAGKTALDGIPPITLAMVRFAVAAAVLWPLALRNGGARPRGSRIALMGLLGIASAFLLQNAGLQRTDAANASMLQGAAPILVVLGASILLRETLGRTRLYGTAIALAGVVAITVTGRHGIGEPGAGDLCALGSAACFAAFILIGRPVFAAYGTVAVLAGAVGWSMVILAPLSVIELASGQVTAIGAETIGLVLYLGIGCSALTYLLWGYALSHMEAGQAAVFDNMVPIIGLIAAAVLLNERPTHWQIAGGLLVVLGAWITSLSNGPEPVRVPVTALGVAL
ncbi:MAG: DMT family transporter [Thermomicrobiales bacterium]|nr:DMT family transporter [Thermomicrobiales bacterium]